MGLSELLMESQRNTPGFNFAFEPAVARMLWECRPLLECLSVPSNAASRALQPRT